jgi:hypothetical protein
MKLRRYVLLTALAALGASSFAGAAPAAAAPIWNLDVHHYQTHFAPGPKAGVAHGLYAFDVNNVGGTNSSGPVSLKVELPPGLSLYYAIEYNGDFGVVPQVIWSCPYTEGASTVTCTTSEPVRRHNLSRRIYIGVYVDPSVEGTKVITKATLEGGGAAAAVTAVEPTPIRADPAPFGVIADSFLPDFYQEDGITPEREAGAHPDLVVFPFDFNTVFGGFGQPDQPKATEAIRDLTVDTPAGFIGNTTAVGECSQALFMLTQCPRSSQVGREDIVLFPFSALPEERYRTASLPVFNLSHPRGAVTDLAFVFAGNPVHIKVTLDPANRYALTSEVPSINESLPAFNQQLTLWGVPGDSSHDAERCGEPHFTSEIEKECPLEGEAKPYLSVPSQCESDNFMRIHKYDSWENPGLFGPPIVHTLPGKMTDCDKPRFEPDVEAEPTGKQANTPTGLDVHIKVAQNENPNALNTPPVKSAVVTLPEGMSFSPSFADGLQSCTPAQIALFTNNPVKCPDASRVGEVELSTPLLPKRAEGSMYLAAQNDNPFNTTFALYMVLEDTEERGVLLKIPGRLDVDPVTGQITTSFDDLPQFPFDDFTLKFRSGPRAPLVSPPACGSHKIDIKVASYAQPTKPVDTSNTYEISEGPGGSPCPPDPANRPFTPNFSGGTLNPVAGTYSPFLFRLSRDDREQELSQVTTILPPGLVAKIAGIPYCPEAAIASISKAEGAGASELNSPACPAASQIGTVSAGLGAGPGPNYFGGKVYLAGPYKGAPLSLAVVAPGIAGPFDLGNVVVRAAVHVDPDTAQVKAISDPFPTILHGVILRARDVRLRVDRPETTLNPTSCERMSVDGQISGVGASLLTTADDSLFNASVPFQVGSCSDLGFKPKLRLRLFGGTKRGAHPKFQATLRMPQGGANISRASVALPPSEFLDQSRIGTVCTRVQFKAETCPPASVYGSAVAMTPLLDEPLKGIVYLRSSDNTLPDLVIALRGTIDFNLVGRIDSVNQGIRNTFDFVPDAPVESFTLTMQGGKKGLLINSRNLCKKTYRATAKFNAQNGKQITLRPKMQNSCGKARKGSKRRR